MSNDLPLGFISENEFLERFNLSSLQAYSSAYPEKYYQLMHERPGLKAYQFGTTKAYHLPEVIEYIQTQEFLIPTVMELRATEEDCGPFKGTPMADKLKMEITTLFERIARSEGDRIVLLGIISKLNLEDISVLNHYMQPKKTGRKSLIDEGVLTYDLIQEYHSRALRGEPREKLKAELAKRAVGEFQVKTGSVSIVHTVENVAKAIERTAMRLPRTTKPNRRKRATN